MIGISRYRGSLEWKDRLKMSTGDSDNITISVDTVTEDDNAVDGELFYRFRVMDNLTGMALVISCGAGAAGIRSVGQTF